MNKFSIIIAFLACSLFTSICCAQTLEEVTLTVSSDGPTKDEAVKNALRSAIEQAYGAFVSANTTILNDELVKDEIVTVSNGSIKEYKELSCILSENGRQFVTLQATVSLPQLIKYSQSKGSECEFAGNTFGMAMKLFELQKENELKALYNLTTQVEALLPEAMTHFITIGEPSIPDMRFWKSAGALPYVDNKNDSYSDKKRDNRFFLKFDPFNTNKDHIYIATVNNEAKQLYNFTIDNLSDYYQVPIKIIWKPAPIKTDEEIRIQVMSQIETYQASLDKKALKEFNKNIQGYTNKAYREALRNNRPQIQSLVTSVLTALSLTKEGRMACVQKGIKTTELYFDGMPRFYLRNDAESINNWAQDFNSKFLDSFCNFDIVDNTGQRSSFYARDILNRWIERHVNNRHTNAPQRFPNEITDQSTVMLSQLGTGGVAILGEGLYHNLFRFESSGSNAFNERILVVGPDYNNPKRVLSHMFTAMSPGFGESEYIWSTIVLIPKSEIGKYSTFKVFPKEQ